MLLYKEPQKPDCSFVLLLIRVLSFHYPLAMHLLILFLALLFLPLDEASQRVEGLASYLCLHFLFHLKRFRHIQSFLNRRSPVDAAEPIADLLKFLDIHARPLRPVYPAEACEICNRHSVTNDPGPFGTSCSGISGCTVVFALLFEAIFKNLVQSLGLGLITLDAVFNLLRGVTVKVVCLTLRLSDLNPEPDCFLDVPALGRDRSASR